MWAFFKKCGEALSGFAFGRLLPTALIIGLGLLLVRGVMRLFSSGLKRAKLEEPALGLIRGVLRGVLYVLLGLIGASALGLDVTGVVTFAGVLTLSLSLSLQEALTNLIGGFTLLYTKPFAIGDFVEIAGQRGTVGSIGLTYTKMATLDNKTISIPNRSVVSAEVINHTAAGTRRTEITLLMSHECPVAQVLEALREAGAVPTALKEPGPEAVVWEYQRDGVVYQLQLWSRAEDYWETTCRAKESIQKALWQRGLLPGCQTVNIKRKWEE